jgi:hypothetical protein
MTWQVLHSSCPDIVTLDLGKIAGKGITMGSDFRVPALAEADRCFGPNSVVRFTQTPQLHETWPVFGYAAFNRSAMPSV